MGDQLPLPATLTALGLDGASLTALASGHINRTWLATLPTGEARVLQALNPIFPAAINRDIDAVTRHLAAKRLPTPRLVPAPDGALWVEAEGAIWRQLSYVPGRTFERVRDAAQARSAGALLGRFHAALADYEGTFANVRLGVHDLGRHIAALEAALGKHGAHREHGAVTAIANDILAQVELLPALPRCPDRNVHGDPKISNVVFDAAGTRAICLIDLDTLARMPVALELGDALRSWCNAGAEDAADARVDTALFRAAIGGYATQARAFLGEPEWRGIPAAALRIAVELAARFCADALNERYFGWDRARYPSASAHNQARARAQLALADSIAASLPALEHETESAFSARPAAR